METKTIRKISEVLQAYGPLSICNPKSAQWLFLACEYQTHSSLVISTSCLYSQIHSRFLWLLTQHVPALSYCLNVCRHASHTCECLYFLASYSWMWWCFLLLKILSFWDLVWLTATTLSLKQIITWESLRCYLRS